MRTPVTPVTTVMEGNDKRNSVGLLASQAKRMRFGKRETERTRGSDWGNGSGVKLLFGSPELT